MNRRSLLRLSITGTGLVPLSGCFGSDINSFDPKYEVIERQEYPDKPTSLTSETTAEFVAEYEEIERHNANADGRSDVTDFSISCAAATEIDTGDGYYVLTICGGSVTIEDSVVGELAPNPVFYFISDDQMIRVRDRDHKNIETYGSETDESGAQGVRIVNFASVDHTINITLTHGSESGDEVALDETVSVPDRYIFSLTSAIGKKGDYEVSAHLETGTVETVNWSVDDLDPPYGMNIYITQNDQIQFTLTSNPRFP